MNLVITQDLFARSISERLVSKFPIPRWLSILILWELFFLVDYVYSLLIIGNSNHTTLFCLLTIFFASVCINTMYCCEVLRSLYPHILLFADVKEDDLYAWYTTKMKQTYQGVWSWLSGLAISALATLSLHPFIVELTPADSFLISYRIAYLAVGFFFLGSSLWALVSVIRIPLEMTNFKIRINIHQFSGNGLLALGSSFFKMSISVAISFGLIVITAVLSPYGNNLFVLFWLGGGALLILIFFIFPQWNIHSLMVKEKTERIINFSPHLEKALENSLCEPTTENMRQLKELFELQHHLKNMNEWPFDTQSLWQLITALLIPIIVAVLELVF